MNGNTAMIGGLEGVSGRKPGFSCFSHFNDRKRKKIMKKIGYFVLMAVVSAVFAACGSPAGNAPANNANANVRRTQQFTQPMGGDISFYLIS